MEIHKPKAAHSLREFLTEIGTIICGILIALGLEQAVETIHRDREVREAREALLQEIAQDSQRLRLTLEGNACLERQLDAYAAWAMGGPKPAPFRAFRPLLRGATWDTVKSTAAPHMPLTERVALAAFYDQLANVERNADRETTGIELVVAFADLPALDGADRTALLKAIAQARRAAHVVDGGGSRLADVADGFAKPDKAISPLPKVLRSGVDWSCGRDAPDPYAVGH